MNSWDPNKYYTFKNLDKNIFPLPHSLPDNTKYIGITNVRGPEDLYKEFNNPFRENRSEDNSDLHFGIILKQNKRYYNNIPFRIINTNEGFVNPNDILLTVDFLNFDDNKEDRREFLLDNKEDLDLLEEYPFNDLS